MQTTTTEHDYVLVYNPTAKRAERWRVEGHRALVTGTDGKPLTFPTRDDAVQWVKEQEQGEAFNRREQGRDTIWGCICGEQLEIRHFADELDTIVTHTSCGNCGESWWLVAKTNTLHHGTIDEAIAAMRAKE